MTLTSKFKKDLRTLRAAANKEIILDVNVIDQIKDQVETDILDDVIERVKQVPLQKILRR